MTGSSDLSLITDNIGKGRFSMPCHRSELIGSGIMGRTVAACNHRSSGSQSSPISDLIQESGDHPNRKCISGSGGSLIPVIPMPESSDLSLMTEGIGKGQSSRPYHRSELTGIGIRPHNYTGLWLLTVAKTYCKSLDFCGWFLQPKKSSRTNSKQAVAKLGNFATTLLNCIFCSDATRSPIQGHRNYLAEMPSVTSGSGGAHAADVLPDRTRTAPRNQPGTVGPARVALRIFEQRNPWLPDPPISWRFQIAIS
jgi:hypothetical protein